MASGDPVSLQHMPALYGWNLDGNGGAAGGHHDGIGPNGAIGADLQARSQYGPVSCPKPRSNARAGIDYRMRTDDGAGLFREMGMAWWLEQAEGRGA